MSDRVNGIDLPDDPEMFPEPLDRSDEHRDSNPLDPVSWDQIKRAFESGDMESIRKMYADVGMPVPQLGRRQA
jgi:16S rRNA U516 pseudouridylate synthase RsuA-like enzyme